MAYIVIRSQKNVSNTPFFAQSGEDAREVLRSLSEWVRQQPGILRNFTLNNGQQSNEEFFIFDTAENGQQFQSAVDTNLEFAARSAYNGAHGIEETWSVIV